MSLLQENIVYFWLIPVVFQICIPLVMLGGWLANTALDKLFRKTPKPALLVKVGAPI